MNRSIFMLRILLLTAVFAALFGTQTPTAHACSCAPPPDPVTAAANATAVFAGTVTHIDDSQGLVFSSADPIPVTLAVSEVWKGTIGATVTITTARHDASCGFHFTVGEVYIVYAYDVEGSLQTNLCSRTARLADAGEDLTALGAGVVPTAVSPDQPTPAAVPPTILLLTGMSVVLLVALWLIARSSRQEPA